MPHKVSVLMDGELKGEAAQTVISDLRSKEDLRECWAIYHLIGDAMRQTVDLPRDLTPKVSDKLFSEPLILAPRKTAPHRKAKMFLFSAAASLAAVGVVAWVALQNASNTTTVPNPSTTMARAPMAPTPVSEPQAVAALPAAAASNIPPAGKLNDYMMAHHEFSPATAMQGLTPYARSVADVRQDVER